MAIWNEVLSTDVEALKRIGETCNVNPLALEDCFHRDQRPKLDDYETHQLLVWFMMSKSKIYELQFLIFPEQLIMVPHENPPNSASWKEYLKLSDGHKDVWHLLYQALDRATDITWQEIRDLFDQIDEFEDTMFAREVHPQSLLSLKKQFNHIDYSIGHLSSVTKQLQNLSQPKGDLRWKLRDLHDHCERITQSISLYRSQIATAIELYWGLQANKTNNQIKKLSLLASIAVPLTFWGSFWGMNFQAIPYHDSNLFYVAIGIMLVSVLMTVWFLVKKGYWAD